jgi:hypothetical protein
VSSRKIQELVNQGMSMDLFTCDFKTELCVSKRTAIFGIGIRIPDNISLLPPGTEINAANYISGGTSTCVCNSSTWTCMRSVYYPESGGP